MPEIKDVADYVGDSLGLAQQAAKTNADVIVFCGVHFMAETAEILDPNKIVVLPDKDAGCSLEESCPTDKLAALQKTNPNFWTIAYINRSAAEWQLMVLESPAKNCRFGDEKRKWQ